MTNEENQLLLNDLCARLPHGGTYEANSKDKCYQSAIEMAVYWKEQQNKELITLIIKWFELIQLLATDRKNSGGYTMSEQHTLDEIRALAKDAVSYIKTINEGGIIDESNQRNAKRDIVHSYRQTHAK